MTLCNNFNPSHSMASETKKYVSFHVSVPLKTGLTCSDNLMLFCIVKHSGAFSAQESTELMCKLALMLPTHDPSANDIMTGLTSYYTLFRHHLAA